MVDKDKSINFFKGLPKLGKGLADSITTRKVQRLNK